MDINVCQLCQQRRTHQLTNGIAICFTCQQKLQTKSYELKCNKCGQSSPCPFYRPDYICKKCVKLKNMKEQQYQQITKIISKFQEQLKQVQIDYGFSVEVNMFDSDGTKILSIKNDVGRKYEPLAILKSDEPVNNEMQFDFV